MMGSLFAVVATAVISSRDQAMHEMLPVDAAAAAIPGASLRQAGATPEVFQSASMRH